MKYLVLIFFFTFSFCKNKQEKVQQNQTKNPLLNSARFMDTIISNGEVYTFEPIPMNKRIYSFQSDSLGDYIAAKILIDSKKLPESVDSLLSLQLDKFVYDTYYFGRLKNFSILYCEYEYGEGLVIINKKNYQISNSTLLVSCEGDGMDNYFLNIIRTVNGFKQVLIYGTNNESDDNVLRIEKITYNDLVIGHDKFELKNYKERKAKKVVNINKPYVEYK